VHEEGAPVGDEGRVRVALLLVLFVLAPPAVAQRLRPSRRRANGRRSVGRLARLKVDLVGVVGGVCEAQSVHHRLRVLERCEGGIRAGNGRRGLPDADSWRLLWLGGSIGLSLRLLLLCRRHAAVCIAEIAVVCIGVVVVAVDIAGC
jgi:hypothetical protein